MLTIEIVLKARNMREALNMLGSNIPNIFSGAESVDIKFPMRELTDNEKMNLANHGWDNESIHAFSSNACQSVKATLKGFEMFDEDEEPSRNFNEMFGSVIGGRKSDNRGGQF